MSAPFSGRCRYVFYTRFSLESRTPALLSPCPRVQYVNALLRFRVQRYNIILTCARVSATKMQKYVVKHKKGAFLPPFLSRVARIIPAKRKSLRTLHLQRHCHFQGHSHLPIRYTHRQHRQIANMNLRQLPNSVR